MEIIKLSVSIGYLKMAKTLTKKNISDIPYGKEVGFSRGIMGRKLKDGKSVRMFLQKKLHGKPIKTKLGTWPDIDIDGVEAKARLYRKLIDDGMHPYDYEKQQETQRASELQENTRKGITLRQMLERFEKHKLGLGGRGNSKAMISDRRSTLARFFKDYMDHPVANIKSSDLQDWLSKQAEAGQRRRGIRSLVRLRAILNYAVNVEQVIDRNPTNVFIGGLNLKTEKDKVALMPEHCDGLLEMIDRLTNPIWRTDLVGEIREARRAKTNAGVASVYGLISDGEISARRFPAYHAIALLLLTGIRLQEMLRLEWKNVYLDEADWKRIGARGAFFRSTQFKNNGQPTGIPITRQMTGTFKALQALRVDRFVFHSPMSGSHDVAPIKLLRYQFETLQKLLPQIEHKLGANLCRQTFATNAHNLRYDLDMIDRLTGHTGRLDTRGVATENYIANMADDNRKMFEQINITMLDTEDSESDYWDT